MSDSTQRGGSLGRVLWHWSAELLLVGVWLFAVVELAGAVGWMWAGVVAGSVALAVMVVPALRRLVRAWVWCLVVRHRLRLCFAAFIRAAGTTVARPGRLPLILAARPTPAGERVWVWLRPGLDISDLESQCGKLAVACWADQVTVVRSSRTYAALVRIDVARRDPLTASVVSPLPGLVPAAAPAEAGELVEPVALALDLPEVPEPGPVVSSRQRRGPVDAVGGA